MFLCFSCDGNRGDMSPSFGCIDKQLVSNPLEKSETSK